MRFIDKLDYKKLVDIICGTHKNLYVSMPGFTTEIANAILFAEQNGAEVKIAVDNSEFVIRNGYGDQAALQKIIESGATVFECPGNMVSFVVSDNSGYFIFPQSLIFLEDPTGPNAVKIDPAHIPLLLYNYFPDPNITLTDVIDRAIEAREENNILDLTDEELTGERNITVPLDEKKFKENSENLKKNPPLKPNLQRTVNTYNAKIQFVELVFSGGKFENKIVSIPEKALPIENEELRKRLLARMKMFADLDKNEDFDAYRNFQKQVDLFRKAFLTPISCRSGKSIINKAEKEDFNNAIAQLKEAAKKESEKIEELLNQAKEKAKDLLSVELRKYLIQDVKLANYTGATKEKLIEAKIQETMKKIFPDVKKLIGNIDLTVNFFNLTWDDFSDKKLLDELSAKGIMTKEDLESIVEMKEVFETEKS